MQLKKVGKMSESSNVATSLARMNGSKKFDDHQMAILAYAAQNGTIDMQSMHRLLLKDKSYKKKFAKARKKHKAKARVEAAGIANSSLKQLESKAKALRGHAEMLVASSKKKTNSALEREALHEKINSLRQILEKTKSLERQTSAISKTRLRQGILDGMVAEEFLAEKAERFYEKGILPREGEALSYDTTQGIREFLAKGKTGVRVEKILAKLQD